MNDLFEKITKGSILLWNVEEDKDLPKKREMVRLLGTEDFTYYKSHGHYRSHIRTLARLKHCISPDFNQENRGFWSQVPTSHFLFTAQEIEPNSFFILKYSAQCLGSYFVDGNDLRNLDHLLRRYDQVRSISGEITNWPNKIERHMEEIKRDGIEDPVIENFQIARLTAMTDGYGKQAVKDALSKLEAWHEQHYWKSLRSKQPIDALQEDVVMT